MQIIKWIECIDIILQRVNILWVCTGCDSIWFDITSMSCPVKGGHQNEFQPSAAVCVLVKNVFFYFNELIVLYFSLIMFII